MVIVDTSVWIDLFAAHDTEEVALLRDITPGHRVGVGDLMICEVLQGVRSQKQFDQVREILFTLEIVEMVGAEMAIASAANYRTLRQRGVTIRGAVDCLIATYCIERGHLLLHRDRDFDHFERHLGLRVLRR